MCGKSREKIKKLKNILSRGETPLPLDVKIDVKMLFLMQNNVSDKAQKAKTAQNLLKHKTIINNNKVPKLSTSTKFWNFKP